MTINYNDGGIREQMRRDLRSVYGNHEIDTMERLVRDDIIRGLPTSKEFAKGGNTTKRTYVTCAKELYRRHP